MRAVIVYFRKKEMQTLACEEGMVSRVSASKAWVKTRRQEECASCQVRDGCMSLGAGKEVEVEVENTLQARVGDRVVLQIEDSSFLKASFLIYMVPVLGLLVGALGGQWLGDRLSTDPSATAALLGLVCLVGAVTLVKTWGNRLAGDPRYQPRMKKIVARQTP